MRPPLDSSSRDPFREERMRREAPPPAGTTASGRLAESLAASYLQLRGFRILERNLRDGPRELDLIAEQGGWIVVVEVRFRGRTGRGLPEETIHPAKRRNLLRAGRAYWLKAGRGRGLLRFDLISLHFTGEGMRLRHYPHFINPGGREI